MALPSVKPRPTMPASFSFPSDMDGNIIAHPMTAKSQIAPKHPAMHALQNAREHEEELHRAAMLREQGPAGPMIRAMELRAARCVGRLPFLQGSNFQHDVLTGRDEEIDFEDIFNLNPRLAEFNVGPHTVMESIRDKEKVEGNKVTRRHPGVIFLQGVRPGKPLVTSVLRRGAVVSSTLDGRVFPWPVLCAHLRRISGFWEDLQPPAQAYPNH